MGEWLHHYCVPGSSGMRHIIRGRNYDTIYIVCRCLALSISCRTAGADDLSECKARCFTGESLCMSKNYFENSKEHWQI
jgi:hypothetical protein